MLNTRIMLVGNLGRDLPVIQEEVDGSIDAHIGESANGSRFHDTTAALEKEFKTAQAKLARHGRQLNQEPCAPPGAKWFRLIGNAGRTCIFVNLEEVQAFVDKLDGKPRLADAGLGDAA